MWIQWKNFIKAKYVSSATILFNVKHLALDIWYNEGALANILWKENVYFFFSAPPSSLAY